MPLTPDSVSASSSASEEEGEDETEGFEREKVLGMSTGGQMSFIGETSNGDDDDEEEEGDNNDNDEDEDEDEDEDGHGDQEDQLVEPNNSIASAANYHRSEDDEMQQQLRWSSAISQQRHKQQMKPPQKHETHHHHHHQQQSQQSQQQQQEQKDYEEVKQVELFGVCIVALTINGKERLCLAQISNTLLKEFSYNEIHNRRVALGITCVQCTPIQLEMLRRAGAMPSSSRRCGMITMREAERLCRSFLVEEQPPELPENFYFTVAHRVNYGCKGRFIPARYISSRAKCIECFYCGEFYSPNKFIFHSHRQPHATDCNPPDSPNINSWRKHIDLDWTQEHSQEIKYAWEDVKSLFNGGTRRRAPNWPATGSNAPVNSDANSSSRAQPRQQQSGKVSANNNSSSSTSLAAAATRNGQLSNNSNISKLDFDDQVIDVECDFEFSTVAVMGISTGELERDDREPVDEQMEISKHSNNNSGPIKRSVEGKTARPSSGGSQTRYLAGGGRQSSNSVLLISSSHQHHQQHKNNHHHSQHGIHGQQQQPGKQSNGPLATSSGAPNKRQHFNLDSTTSNSTTSGTHLASKRLAACSMIGQANRHLDLDQHHQRQLVQRDKLANLNDRAIGFQPQRQLCSSQQQQQQIGMNQSMRQIQASASAAAQFNPFINLSPTQVAQQSISQTNGNNIKAPSMANLAAYPVSANSNFIYSQLYTQLMQQQQQQQQQQQSQQASQQLTSAMDTQLALRQHLWSSLLANLQCSANNQTYSPLQQQQQQVAPSSPQPPPPLPASMVGHCGPQIGEAEVGLLTPASQLSHLISAQLYAAHQPIGTSKIQSRPNHSGPLDTYSKSGQGGPFTLQKFSAGEANDV